MLANVHDLTYASDARLFAEDRDDVTLRHAEVTLIGDPPWRYWRYQQVLTRETGALRHITSYDGVSYVLLQGDGMGGCFSEYMNDAYMTVAALYLAHLGLGPERPGSTGNWRTFFAIPQLTLTEDSERPGIVTVATDSVTRELDSRYGFMPVRTRVAGVSDREFVFGGYRCYDGLWLPETFEVRGPKPSTEHVYPESVRVNQGLRPEDLRVPFPFGTSVSYDEDVVRVYGWASLAEAEEGLHNWLVYDGVFGRLPAQTKAVGAAAPIRESAGIGPFVAVGNIVLALVFSVLAFGRRRSRRVATTTLLLLAAAPVWADDEPAAVPAEASAVYCTYLTLAIYGRDVALAPLLDTMWTNGPRDNIEERVAERLRAAGVHAEVVEMDFADVERWPYPAIVELRSTKSRPGRPFGVILASGDGQFTMADPNRYGHLAPYPREWLLERWHGRAILTSPVPIRTDNPWRMWAWLSGIAPLLALAALLWRRRRPAAPVTAAAGLVLVLGLTGCDRAAAPAAPAATTTPAAGRIFVEPETWTVASCYPESVRQEFIVRNTYATPQSITDAHASCGCMATVLPPDSTVPARGELKFPVRVHLSGAHGHVKHTLTFRFSDGTAQEVLFSAKVLRGVYPEPRNLTLSSAQPGELVRGEVQLVSDDEQPYEITEAVAPLVRNVEINHDDSTITVIIANENRHATLRDTLTITTTHPHAPTLRVPVLATFELTWAVEPTGVFIHEPGDAEFIERTVKVISVHDVPFVVERSESPAATVEPLQRAPGTVQEVRLRVRRPEVRGASRRVEVALRTTLPAAEEIVVPVVFYR
ncbi:MAG: hypothetical protein PVJ57_15935 [Phycisphaerae bacterium]|jgi:hypothetical protein